jgi:hypothetical protein
MNRKYFIVLLLPLAAHAREGAYEINQDCAVAGCFAGDGAGFPVSITKAGSYVLTSDIIVTSAGANAININASPVDIDLNGHTIDGGGSCSGVPVSSCAGATGNVGISASAGGASVGTLHIHDGTIRGFSNNSAGAAAIYVNDAGDGTVLERLTVVENEGIGAILLYTSGSGGTARLRDSQVARNGAVGIGKVAGSGPVRLIVENTDVSGNKANGMNGFDGSTVSGSRFNSNGTFAIGAIAATVALGANTFSGNNAGGVQYNISNVANIGGSTGNLCLDHPGTSYACP